MSSINGFSSRRGRVVLICGSLVTLLCLFAGLQGSASNLSSRMHVFPVHDRLPSSPFTTSHTTDSEGEPVRWSDFAYVQYVTNPSYLCNALMIFEALRRHGTKAELLMMYPREWKMAADDAINASYESRLLALARNTYKAQLSPVQVMTFAGADPTWQDSHTKLLAWNQTQYRRVISLDSDATVLNHMDELFLLPSTPVAMPRAYWVDGVLLSSQLIVIEPSQTEWWRIQEATVNHKTDEYDMDILNKLYNDSSLVLPHRRYNLLTGELRKEDHAKYLGSPREEWNVTSVLAEAKFVHFSDWPMPKPWLRVSDEYREEYAPKCNTASGMQPHCSDRDAWIWLRTDFAARRERVCGNAHDG